MVHECGNYDELSEAHYIIGICHYYKLHFQRAAHSFKKAYIIDNDNTGASDMKKLARTFISLSKKGNIYIAMFENGRLSIISATVF